MLINNQLPQFIINTTAANEHVGEVEGHISNEADYIEFNNERRELHDQGVETA